MEVSIDERVDWLGTGRREGYGTNMSCWFTFRNLWNLAIRQVVFLLSDELLVIDGSRQGNVEF